MVVSNVCRKFAYQFTKQSTMKLETFYKIAHKDGKYYYPFVRAYGYKLFYPYNEKPNLSVLSTLPDFVKIENLTNPNREAEKSDVAWERTLIKTEIGDILTIETDEQRFVIVSHDPINCYLLFSGDNQMEWPTKEQMEQKAVEVVEALNRDFVEHVLQDITMKILHDITMKIGIDPFNNFDQIVDFIIEDVKTAAMGDFSDENIRIAFRRFVEREM